MNEEQQSYLFSPESTREEPTTERNFLSPNDEENVGQNYETD
jgi:hypothetical protein